MRPVVLQTCPLIASCEAALPQNFELHRLFEGDRDAVLRSVGDKVQALASGGVDRALMEALPSLKMIANFGVGYDNVDIAAARERGIRVSNTPEVLNDAVAELCVGLMIGLARRIPQADAFTRAGRWPGGTFPLQSELNGKIAGIVGLGRIGKEIAHRLQAMRMRVVYHGRREQSAQPYQFYSDLVAMARDVDWLVVIAPGGAATERLVSRAVLEALGPEGRLVNVARGSLVDETALVELLLAGKLGGAALDVFADEPNVPEALFRLETVVLSPHQGSATRQTRDAMGALLVRNLEAFFAGEPLPSPVA